MDSKINNGIKIPGYIKEMSSQVEQLLVLLSQKEKFVIERRFNLDNKKKATLEEIGQHFNVTRERIRQIEKNALQKLRRNIEKFDFYAINDYAHGIIVNCGGFMREDFLISKLLTEYSSYSAESLLLILSLDKRFEHIGNTIHYAPYFRLSTYNDDLVNSICSYSISYLNKKGDVLKTEILVKELVENVETAKLLPMEAFRSLFQINKSFKLIDESVGLQEWRHIHPRTLRDKIYYVLRAAGKSMHFVDIANAIVAGNFDKKNLNLQAVHNELIRHADFVLIGRGIYALKEWGYSHGTVADVISAVLAGKESLSEDEIIAEVLKRRQVKPITIILNLKNKSDFVRVGRKQYALKNA